MVNYNQPVRKLNAVIKQRKGTTVYNTYQEYLISFEVQRVAENNKFFGMVICNRLNAKFRKGVGIATLKTEGRHLQIFIKDDVSEYEAFFPRFYINEIRVDENTGDISVFAYDWIKKTEDKTVADLSLTKPYTVQQFLNSIATLFGATIEYVGIDENLLSLSYTNGANLEGTETIKDCLGQIAELLGAICYINYENHMVFRKLDKDGDAVAPINKENYYTLKSGDNKRLGQIIYATELGDNIEAHTSESGSTQVIRNNAFIDVRADKETLIQNAIATDGGLTIGKFEMEWQGNPNYQIGDKLAITARDGSTISSFLLDEVITFDGGLSSKLRFGWDENQQIDTSANPSTIGEAIYQTYAKVDKINKEIALVASDLETTASSLQTQINNIDVGGRNLLLGTGTEYSTTSGSKSNSLYTKYWNESDYGISITTGNTTDEFTVSFDYEVTGNENEAATVYWQYCGAKGNAKDIEIGANTSGHYTHTMKITASQSTASSRKGRIRLYNATNGANITIKNLKWEKGNKETSYTVAPEDIDAEITTTKNTLNNTVERVGSLEVSTNAIEGRVSAVETNVETNTTNISSLQGDMTTTQTQVETNKTDIAQLKIDKNTISAQVESLNTTTQSINTTIGNIQEDIDNMEVGGRNLFIAKDRTNNKYYTTNNVLGAWERTIASDYIPVNEGDNYILQTWQPENTYTGNNRSYSYIISCDSEQNCIARLLTGYYSDEYKKLELAIPADVAFIRAIYHMDAGGVSGENWNPYGNYKVKLEKGTMPTEWSIAPEDVESEIATVNSQVTTNKENIASLTLTTSGISSQVSSLESTTQTMQADIDNIDLRNMFIKSKAERSVQSGITDYLLSPYGQDTVLNGSKITISFDAISDEENTIMDIYPRYNPSKPTNHSASINKNFFTVGTEWARYSKTLTMPTVSYAWLSWRFRSNASVTGGSNTATVSFRNVKLELGDKATPYTVAPEDVESGLETAQENITTLNSSVSSLTQTANAFSATITSIQEDVDGLGTNLQEAIDTTNATINSLQQQVNAKMTSTEVELAISEALSNGVDSITTSTGYRFDKDGLTISKSNSDISTIIDNEGMRVSTQFEDVLTATNSGVNALNLTARNFLIIGTRSRLQDYGIDQTGIFWIGD